MSSSNNNPMTQIYLDKLIINIGIGSDENLYNNAKALLNKLTNHEAMPTVSKKRLPELKLKQGQIIGAMVTLRKGEALSMLKRALDANNNVISENAIANNSINFGVKEYIYFSGVKYDPKIGMLGMNINGAFARKGKRIESRKRLRSKIKLSHRNISEEEIREYLQGLGASIVGRER